MMKRFATIGLVLLIVATGLAMADSRGSSASDLDAFTDAQLRRDLLAELDDIDFPIDEQHALDELREAILDALSDEGDDAGDDAAEEEIDFSDLEAEMEEAEMTIEGVVDAALARADELVRNDAAAPWVFAANTASHTWVNGSSSMFAAQSRNARRGFTTTRIAIQQTTNGIIAGVRRAR